MANIAYVLIEHFAVAVEQLAAGNIAGPLILGGYPYERKTVYDASPEAIALGVRPGQPLRQAHGICPNAVFLPLAEARYEQAAEDFLAVVESFSPAADPDGLGRAYFDARGLERLHGQAEELARRLSGAIYRRLGLVARVGLGPTRFTALVAARLSQPDLPCVVSHDPVAFLADLSVDHFAREPGAVTAKSPVDLRSRGSSAKDRKSSPGDRRSSTENASFEDRLRLLGIRTIGQFMRLPVAELMEQFGPAGVAAYQLASGQVDLPVLPRPRPAALQRTQSFEPPIDDAAALTHAIEPLSTAIAATLERRYQACQTVLLRLELAGRPSPKSTDLVEYVVPAKAGPQDSGLPCVGMPGPVARHSSFERGRGMGTFVEETAQLKEPASSAAAITAAVHRLIQRLLSPAPTIPSRGAANTVIASRNGAEATWDPGQRKNLLVAHESEDYPSSSQYEPQIIAVQLVVSGLVAQGASQPGLFDALRQRRSHLQEAAAEVHRRFGDRLKRAEPLPALNSAGDPTFILRDYFLPNKANSRSGQSSSTSSSSATTLDDFLPNEPNSRSSQSSSTSSSSATMLDDFLPNEPNSSSNQSSSTSSSSAKTLDDFLPNEPNSHSSQSSSTSSSSATRLDDFVPNEPNLPSPDSTSVIRPCSQPIRLSACIPIGGDAYPLTPRSRKLPNESCIKPASPRSMETSTFPKQSNPAPARAPEPTRVTPSRPSPDTATALPVPANGLASPSQPAHSPSPAPASEPVISSDPVDYPIRLSVAYPLTPRPNLLTPSLSEPNLLLHPVSLPRPPASSALPPDSSLPRLLAPFLPIEPNLVAHWQPATPSPFRAFRGVSCFRVPNGSESMADFLVPFLPIEPNLVAHWQPAASSPFRAFRGVSCFRVPNGSDDRAPSHS